MKHIHITLSAKKRGFHLITDEITSALPKLPNEGLLHLFLKHTSAGLCINENADPTVRTDMHQWFLQNIKENEPYFEHTLEGPDDMPGHIKAVLTGNTISIPIIDGQLALGTWQGIYLGEFRNHGGNRKIIVTILN